MTKTAFLLALIVTVLASMPAQAQRVFVSGTGLDTNPCTVTQPCRTFQQAYNTVPANGEIDVLDPAGYGPPFVITHGISIQGHGWGSITQSASCVGCAAITISVATSDPVTLNGLILDGASTGTLGINITSGPSVLIFNSVVRHFQFGINDGRSTNGSKLLIEDTIASDNQMSGIVVEPNGSNSKATLSRITANNNTFGVVSANNSNTTIANSVMSNNSIGLQSDAGVAWLAKTVISGNGTGVNFLGGTVRSYGDNYINDNTTPVMGSLTPVATQ
jgi:Right handed beta helix region